MLSSFWLPTTSCRFLSHVKNWQCNSWSWVYSTRQQGSWAWTCWGSEACITTTLLRCCKMGTTWRPCAMPENTRSLALLWFALFPLRLATNTFCCILSLTLTRGLIGPGDHRAACPVPWESRGEEQRPQSGCSAELLLRVHSELQDHIGLWQIPAYPVRNGLSSFVLCNLVAPKWLSTFPVASNVASEDIFI